MTGHFYPVVSVLETMIYPKDPRWFNFMVTLSNVWGLLLSLDCDDLVPRLLFQSVAIASVLMHLSETKHKLPGIWPFNQWSGLFLNVDRAMSLVVVLYLFLFDLHETWARLVLMFLNYRLFSLSVVVGGLVALLIAENPWVLGRKWSVREGKLQGYWLYAASHMLWHYCAYTMLSYLLINPYAFMSRLVHGV